MYVLPLFFLSFGNMQMDNGNLVCTEHRAHSQTHVAHHTAAASTATVNTIKDFQVKVAKAFPSMAKQMRCKHF